MIITSITHSFCHVKMKPLSALIALASVTTAAASSIYIPTLSAKQPNGNADGQTNYYTIQFTVVSDSGDDYPSGYCWASWGDNNNLCTGSACVPYSTYVPTGSWIQCAHNSSNIDDQTSEFSFQLYPYFSIGNVSLSVQQNYSQTV